MKFKEIMACHAFDVMEAREKVYHDDNGNDTKEKIIYLIFDEKITYYDLTEDFAVMSRRVAREFRSLDSSDEKIAFLESCEFFKDDSDGHSQFGLKMPVTRLFRFEPSNKYLHFE